MHMLSVQQGAPHSLLGVLETQVTLPWAQMLHLTGVPVRLTPERTRNMLLPNFLGLLDAFILRSGGLIQPAMADPLGPAARQLQVRCPARMQRCPPSVPARAGDALLARVHAGGVSQGTRPPCGQA